MKKIIYSLTIIFILGLLANASSFANCGACGGGKGCQTSAIIEGSDAQNMESTGTDETTE
ncbi:secreted protein [Candidatus Omnitrophus magneticus]|uniref:Secreted protein n=1 Tax=Candidatus Omnitrophus magneticus TaxID=1609969 RepID=A0A0F0CS64_9BACT|nr:secreted protein [Candidatus Omnitrophus magneticus]